MSDTYSRFYKQGNKYTYLARVLAGEFCKGDSSSGQQLEQQIRPAYNSPSRHARRMVMRYSG
jgi:hypothetical protein